MATTTTTAPLTLEEFYDLPSKDFCKQELIEGELIELPPPKRAHGHVAVRIEIALRKYLFEKGADQARALREWGFQVSAKPASFLIPDVAFLYEKHPGKDYDEGAPLLAIEVLSKSNRAALIDRKIRLYLSHGAQEVWVADPKTRSVMVHRAEEASAVRYENSLESALFPDLVLDLNLVFGAA